jgi:hypothetical protein
MYKRQKRLPAYQPQKPQLQPAYQPHKPQLQPAYQPHKPQLQPVPQLQPAYQPQKPQPATIEMESEEDVDYSSDDSLDYVIGKAFVYPDLITSAEMAKLSWPAFNHINNHPARGDCGCPYKNATFEY